MPKAGSTSISKSLVDHLRDQANDTLRQHQAKLSSTVDQAIARAMSSRRDFLHLAGGSMVVAAVLPSIAQAAPVAQAGSDAELIDLCARHCEIDNTCKTLFQDEANETPEEVFADLSADQHSIGTDILDLEITSVAGAVAVAKTLALYEADWINEPCGRNYEFVSMLVRGLIALGAKEGGQPL